MKRISIERYPTSDKFNLDGIGAPVGAPRSEPDYAGLIEGVRDDGTGWIMWLDESGSPEVFWGARGEDGAVEGEPIMLNGARWAGAPRWRSEGFDAADGAVP